jgi:hypothetical protein
MVHLPNLAQIDADLELRDAQISNNGFWGEAAQRQSEDIEVLCDS